MTHPYYQCRNCGTRFMGSTIHSQFKDEAHVMRYVRERGSHLTETHMCESGVYGVSDLICIVNTTVKRRGCIPDLPLGYPHPTHVCNRPAIKATLAP